jgi:hypothetical protein
VIFNQAIIFGEDWIEKTNLSKNTKEERLAVNYKNGYKGTTDFDKNELTGWKVVSAEER